MRKKVVIIALASVGTIVLAGGSWAWHTRQAKASSDRQALRQQSEGYAPADATAGTFNAPDASGIAISGGTTSAQTQAQTSGNTGVLPAQSSSSAASDSTSVTLDPIKFSQYDKYKSNQNALIANIKTGSGAEATSGKKLSVNYRGWLTNGSTFDQNVDASKPFSFVLGAHSVITGWEQGIAGMKAGGERLLIIPPAAGYGSIPQGSIPGDSVLIFYIKLLAVE